MGASDSLLPWSPWSPPKVPPIIFNHDDEEEEEKEEEEEEEKMKRGRRRKKRREEEEEETESPLNLDLRFITEDKVSDWRCSILLYLIDFEPAHGIARTTFDLFPFIISIHFLQKHLSSKFKLLDLSS